MDSSASPVQQRYTAGGCALDITLQPSSLSQWYPRPIAQTLTFKLWLGTSGEGEEQTPILVAEGDHETLQAIADYIAQQTRAALTLAALNHSPTSLLPPAPCPPSFRLQSPLSYLQLCDLTAALNQYEQAIYILPVSLSPSAAVSRPRGRLIAFPAHRGLWASAAAALLAVGLTTALLTQTDQDTAVVSDSSPTDSGLHNGEPSPQQDTAQRADNAPQPESAPAAPEPAAESPSRAKPTPSADRRPASTNSQNSQRPSPNRPASPAITADRATSPEPPLAAAGAPPPEETTGSRREAQSETQSAEPNTADGSADVPSPDLPAPSTARQSTARQSAVRAPDDERAQTSLSADATLQAGNLDIIVQVQNYFQAQWQAGNRTVQLPLSYRLQISRSGEVISFTGVSEAAQQYRDHLLPADDPPTFSRSANEPLTLRLTLTADGLVQVTEP